MKINQIIGVLVNSFSNLDPMTKTSGILLVLFIFGIPVLVFLFDYWFLIFMLALAAIIMIVLWKSGILNRILGGFGENPKNEPP